MFIADIRRLEDGLVGLFHHPWAGKVEQVLNYVPHNKVVPKPQNENERSGCAFGF